MFENKFPLDVFLNITIFEDNQACIQKATHPVMSEFSKYINVEYQLVSDHIWNRTIKIFSIESMNRAADVMYKILILPVF